jgi:hypothetical protein
VVDGARRFAAENGLRALVVFDGRAPEEADDVVGSGPESADDWIARRAAELAEPYWLVTSDRELRRRAGGRAERTIGGGSFAGEISGR